MIHCSKHGTSDPDQCPRGIRYMKCKSNLFNLFNCIKIKTMHIFFHGSEHNLPMPKVPQLKA